MKKKIIIACILLILGAGAVLAAMLPGPGSVSPDLEGITGSSVGQRVRLSIDGGEYMPVDGMNGIYIQETEENAIAIRVYVPDEMQGALYLDDEEEGIIYTGKVQRASAEMKEETTGILMDYFEWVDEISDDWELTDEERANIREAVSDYCIEVISSDARSRILIRRGLMILGGVLLLSALLLVISIIARKPFAKVLAVSACTLALAALVFIILFYKQLHLMQNIRKDGEGVYFMTYDRELKLDDMLASGITSDDEMLAWIDRAEFHGLCPVSVDTGRYGCSSFAARTPDGDVIFGRNFDYPESDTVMIYTDPEDGYASYAMADLAVIGVGREKNEVDPVSLPGRFMMLVAPYIVCDGVNEVGLGVSTLELDIGENHQDTGRPDMFVYTAIRVILDRCATVDEAVKLLEGYDIHSHGGVRQHLFIVDDSGRSVVVEWFDDRMYVNDLNAVTNSVLTPGDHYGEEADWRLDVILDELDACEGILTTDQAASLLGKVCLGSMTQWSAVYDLNDFSAEIYVDKDYGQAYTYGGRS
ncbi:MAG: linear amide C-N hydrolase [Lachnospiraceae bacterium]|nr:linear amide C-N hydrolase [Lachnospiraceae bacterium]